MARTTRKEREIDNTRREILRAAARAAATHGFESITLRDIARETGYTVGTLYTYFDGKEAILEGLIGETGDIVLQTLEEPMPSGLSFAQKLELLVQRQLRVAEEWREAVFVLMAVMLQGGIVTRSMKLGTDTNFHTTLAKWIKANAPASDLEEQEPIEVSLVYLGVLQAVITGAMLRKSKQPLINLVPKVMHYLSHGIRAVESSS